MRRVCIFISMLLIVSLTAGCQLSGFSALTDKDETTAADHDASPGEDAKSDQDVQVDAGDIGDPMPKNTYDQIDWNLDSYSEYFCVISSSSVIHYWNGRDTILVSFPGMLMYVSSGPSAKSFTVDLETGDVSECYSNMMMSVFGTDGTDAPPQTLGYMGTDNFEGQDVIVYSAEVDGGTASYFINKANLTCIGWTYDSAAGSVTYILGENPAFEDVVDAIFEYEKDLPDDSDGEPDYSDTDGDGFSDWNEDRLPTLEEMEELKDLWKSEGMSRDEYLTQISKMFSLD